MNKDYYKYGNWLDTLNSLGPLGHIQNSKNLDNIVGALKAARNKHTLLQGKPAYLGRSYVRRGNSFRLRSYGRKRRYVGGIKRKCGCRRPRKFVRPRTCRRRRVICRSKRRRGGGSMDASLIKNWFMPTFAAQREVVAENEKKACDVGQQIVFTYTSCRAADMDNYLEKARDVLPNSLQSDFVANANFGKDLFDRRMKFKIEYHRVVTLLMNTCSHDLVVHRYLFRCRKSTSRSPLDLWNVESGLSQTTDATAGELPTEDFNSSSYGEVPTRYAYKNLKKYYRIMNHKMIAIDVGTQYKDIWSQPPGWYYGVNWRNNVDMNATDTGSTFNANTVHWPGEIVSMYIVKSKDYVVDEGTGGSGKITAGLSQINKQVMLQYKHRYCPLVISHQTGAQPMLTSFTGTANQYFNPETETIVETTTI